MEINSTSASQLSRAVDLSLLWNRARVDRAFLSPAWNHAAQMILLDLILVVACGMAWLVVRVSDWC